MASSDRGEDEKKEEETETEEKEKTFKANFTAEGVARLKERIEEKLKEFMGDYTDDTLVEYVIVLLRNGRRKAEAAQELHVFLGDDNLAFIAWLWDHLSFNLHLYVEPPPPREQPLKRPRRDWNLPQTNELDRGKRQKIVWEERPSTNAHAKEKEKAQPNPKPKPKPKEERIRTRASSTFPLRSVVASVLNSSENNNDKQERARHTTGTGRSRLHSTLRQDDSLHPINPRLPLNAPRRLLQFAVRDAVKPIPHPPSFSTTQPPPAINRLRSVLSAPPPEELREQKLPQEEQEEEEDNQSNSTCPSPLPPHRATPLLPMPSGSTRAERSSVFDRLSRSTAIMGIPDDQIEGKYSSDSASPKDAYDMVEYSVAQEKEAELTSKGLPAVPPSHIVSKPSKILNISVNVNTWKSPGMVQETHSFSLQNNNMSKAENKEVSVPAMVQKVLPKTPIPVASRSLEDPDSRTLFVSNVHFGATKDALSRHFNKFGAVLKVIILADVSTGQPTGSAYIEFLQKESAEAALSLNSTSFMSRILKVVRKNSQESGPATGMGWGPSRVVHVASSLTRPAVRPPYLVRGRAPVRGGGGRSLQWKRGGQPSEATSNASNAGAAVRSFTYTRVPGKAPPAQS